jgi:hypothetical protein
MEDEGSLKSQVGIHTPHPSDARPSEVGVMVRFSEFVLQSFKAEIRQVLAAIQPRVRAQEQSVSEITVRAREALSVITTTIRKHPGTGQSRRLVRFVAACYNGTDYPFDLTNLRGLDTRLASACLDYLDYDRLSICEVHHHLPDGERTLLQWLRDYDIRVATHVCR